MLGLNGLYTALAPNSLRPAAGYAILVVCLWISVCDLSFITSYSKWMGLCSSSSCVCLGSQSDLGWVRNVSKGECYYRAKKHFREDMILQNYCRTIYPMFLRTFFSENYYFLWETKIVPREKNTVKVKEVSRRVTILQIWGNHVAKRI
jgi:hypothetical protein